MPSRAQHGRRCDEPARMARPRVLLVGGNPPMAEMLTDYFHHDDRYEIESVEYCDNALAVLQRRRFDLILVLSLHVPWTMRPSSYSATWRIDFVNAILFLKHMRALHSRSEEHTSELQSRLHLVCRLLLEKKKGQDHSSAQQ